jgi:hypothetical protein
MVGNPWILGHALSFPLGRNVPTMRLSTYGKTPQPPSLNLAPTQPIGGSVSHGKMRTSGAFDYFDDYSQ